jgi:peptidyl-prolyl cis-trans isomerase SurA
MNIVTRALAPILSALAVTALFAIAPANAQSIKVVVNNAPITSLQIQERKALLRLVERKTVSDKEATKQLVDEVLVKQEGTRRRVSVSDEEVNTRYAGVAASTKLSQAQLKQALAQGGTSENAFKAYIRGQLLGRKVLASRFDISRAVGQSDITAQLSQQREAGKGGPATHKYTVRQIIFVLPKNASAADVQRRRQEAVALRGRVSSCDQAASFARSLRNVAVKEPTTRSTSQIGETLDKELSGLKIGGMTTPERGDSGVEMIALCDREAIVDDSYQRQKIQYEMADEKFKVERENIMADLRKRAVIDYR